MSAAGAWFAQGEGFDLEDVIQGWRTLAPETREGFILFGALFLVIAVIFVWAAFFRPKDRRRHSRHHRHRQHSSPPDANVAAKESAVAKPLNRSRRRRRHRHHEGDRPRNPTLAETGGLPPSHAGDPPPPS